MKTVAILAALLLATGCTRAVTYAKAGDAVAEEQVDAGLELTQGGLCALPMKTFARVTTDPNIALAAWYGCETVRDLVNNIIAAHQGNQPSIR